MDIARGDINIDLNQGEALSGLAKLDSEFDATLHRISGMRAEAQVGLNTDRFDAQVDKAESKLASINRAEARAELKANSEQIDAAIDRVKAKLAELKRERAEAVVGANIADADRKIKDVELKLTRLASRKAEVKVEVREGQRTLDQLDRMAKFQDQRNRAISDTEKAVNSLADAERRSGLNMAQQEVHILNLKKQYADLTDEAEKLAKKTAYGREAKIKLSLASDKVVAELETKKRELEVLGEIPPVHIKVDTDGSLLDRAKLQLADFFNKVRGGFDSIGSTRINLGPITASLRGLLIGAAALAPIITSLGGGIVALAGSITTSLAGAAAIGGGLFIGLAGNLVGVVSAIKPAIQGFSEARAATQAYSVAVNKYGDESKQAKKAQEEMNSVLKSVPATSRDAAVGLADISDKWHKLTGDTANRDFGAVIINAVKTAKALLPGFASDTNQTLDIVRGHIDSVFAHLRQPGESKGLQQLGSDANKFLGPALSGLERFGAGFLHIGEAGARIFGGPLGEDIKHIGEGFEHATQPGAKLDGTITRLGHDASDLFHFLGAAGSLLATVLNGASSAGDRLTNSMTGALKGWNSFLKTERGQQDMSKFFERSVTDVKELAHALFPLVAAFVQWSSLLAPFTSGLLKGVSYISRLVAGFVKLTGLAGPLGALGATLGAAFAVGKIGTFVNYLVRAVSLVKELGAVGTIGKVLSGGFGNLLKLPDLSAAGTGIGESAASTMEAAAAGIGESIGAAASAAMDAGAVTAGAEAGVARTVVPAGEGAAGAAGLESAAAGAGAASSAIGGLAESLGGVSTALVGAGGLAVLLGLHFLHSAEHMTDFKETLKALQPQLSANENNANRLANATRGLDESNAEAGSSFRQSTVNLHALKDALDNTKTGTRQHTEAEISYNNALRENVKLGEQWNSQKKETQEVSDRTVTGLKENLKALKETEAVQRNNISNAKALGNTDAQKRDEKALYELQQRRTLTIGALNEALDRQASVNARLARSFAGLPALTAASTESLGKLARTAGAAGQAIAKAVAVKYTSSADVSNVSSEARKALGGGVSSTAILHVLADTSSAKQAIESLRAAANVTKHLDIIERGGPAAVAMLAKIAGVHLSKKDVAILQHGGEAAIGVALRLIGAIGKIQPKTVALAAHVFGTSDVNALVAAINGVHSVTATVRTVTENVTKFLSLGGAPKRAEGGPVLPAEKTYGGQYSQPTLLVGEESRPEYVIATNPAYRDNNIVYLKEAAAALGIDMAAKGKGKTKAIQGTPKRAHLEPPAAFEAAAVPLEPVEKIAKALEKAVKIDKDKLAGLGVSIKKARETYDSSKSAESRAKAGKPKETAHAHTVKAHKQLTEYEEGARAIRNGGGTWRGVHYSRSLHDLEAESKEVRDRIGKLEATNAQITHYNSVIGNDQTKLQNLATIFNGHGPRAGSSEVKGQWETVMGDRKSAINSILGILTRSRNEVSALRTKNPNKELEALFDTRENEISGAESSQVESEESNATGLVANGGVPSAEQYVEGRGEKNTLALLNEAYAIAQTNNVRDIPTTSENEEIPTLFDDEKAAQALRDFWSGELSYAQATGAPVETITDIANAFTSAKSAAEGVESSISEGSKAQQETAYQEGVAFGGARLELYKNFGSNVAPTWSQPGVASSSPAQSQATPIQQTTTHVQVTNNYTAPPLDAHSWSKSLQFELGAMI